MSDYAESVSDWTCVRCGRPCRRGHDWREAGDGRVAHNACADRAREDGGRGATNTRTEERTIMANNTLAELAEQLAALTEKTEALRSDIESYVDDTLRRRGMRLVKVSDHAEPGELTYALPTPHFAEQAIGEPEAELRRQLREAEAWLESADSWVERERADQRIESLRRELGYSAFDRPSTNTQVIAVERERLAERRFAEPVPYTNREDAQARVDRFERRTRS
jgi:ribosomal protein S15P/S13E